MSGMRRDIAIVYYGMRGGTADHRGRRRSTARRGRVVRERGGENGYGG